MAEVLLFDLGGVLLDIDFGRAFAAWGAHAGVPGAEVARRFSFDVHNERHERGEITGPEYFDTLRQSLQLPLSDQQFEAGWNAIIIDEKREITQLVAALPPDLPLYVFSNANVLHERHWNQHFAAVLTPFRHVFVSSNIGRRKPEAEAFAHVAAEIGTAPERILFFDDLLPNVEGARRAGLQAVHVDSVEAVRQALAPFARAGAHG